MLDDHRFNQGQRWIGVLGMHRSGTSTVARILREAGFDFGDERLLYPPDPIDNPDGYWEHGPLVSVSDDILRTFGRDWTQLPFLSRGWSKREELQPLAERARQIFSGFTSERCAWKDPRAMALMEFWKDANPGARYVLVVRNPIEAALSLSKRRYDRGYLSLAEGLELWQASHERLFQDLKEEDLTVIHYGRLIENPEREIRRLLSLLDVPISEDQIPVLATTVRQSGINALSPDHLESILPDPQITSTYRRLYRLSGIDETDVASDAKSVDRLLSISRRVLAAAMRDSQLARSHPRAAATASP